MNSSLGLDYQRVIFPGDVPVCHGLIPAGSSAPCSRLLTPRSPSKWDGGKLEH